MEKRTLLLVSSLVTSFFSTSSPSLNPVFLLSSYVFFFTSFYSLFSCILEAGVRGRPSLLAACSELMENVTSEETIRYYREVSLIRHALSL